MSNRTIYDALRAAGMTAEGACGLMGNMMAESAMRSNNAQDSYGVDDAAYTFSADAGQNNFCNDSIGYGLCQWTSADRKRKRSLLHNERKLVPETGYGSIRA